MYKFILLLIAGCFFICISCSVSFSKTLDSYNLQREDMNERVPEKGNDSLIILGENGNTITCSLLDDKKFHCNLNGSKGYTGFTKDYLVTDTTEKQYVYFLNDAGSLLTECQFNIRKKGAKPDIGNCQARKDIILPVKILTGRIIPGINKLLLLGENSEIYQCSYGPENKITGCYPGGLKSFAATDIILDSLHNKIYLYSASAEKIYSCSYTSDSNSIKNCSPLNTNTGFPDKNIRHVTMTSDQEHMLLTEKHILHYCNIDNEKLELSNCVNVYDKLSNITSLAYSKNNNQILYVIDDHIIKSCYFDDIEVHCYKMDLNADIKGISAFKLLTANVFTFLPVKVKNLGAYSLSVLYKNSLNPGREGDRWKQKKLLISQSVNLLVKGGTGIQLHAAGGDTKCFIINRAGEIHCNRGARNMACYYNDSSKKIINTSCPLPAPSTLCTASVVDYVKRVDNKCYPLKVSKRDNTIIARCWGRSDILRDNKISCYAIQKAMRLHKKIKSDDGTLVIE